jgi:hypothetical protein
MITVKLMSRRPAAEWLRYFPGGVPEWGGCRFVFDAEAREYDWLAVYDDLPPYGEERRSMRVETLACAPAHSLLVTTEPSSIKAYGRAFCAQFGYVLTSQEPWALKHPGRIYSQPALHWFYGTGGDHMRTLDEMRAHPPLAKTGMLSTVGSGKQQKHTMHFKRYQFIQRIKEAIPEMDVYGRGYIPMPDKAQALDGYRYHLAVENHHSLHHWTEKLSDPLLGACLPFYAGCPNAADYFPPESFIALDIHDPEGAIGIIRTAMANGEYEKRLPAILEARRRVLEEYSLIAVLAREIAARHDAAAPGGQARKVYSRRALRVARPWTAIEQLLEKLLQRLRSRAASPSQSG